MRPRFNQLTEKYRAFRLAPDSLYQSRLLQTLFNKFTKKGKKALARRHLAKVMTALRFSIDQIPMKYVLLRILRRLRIQFLLASRRKGKQILAVPVPVRRNKRDVLNVQTLFVAISRRRERTLVARCEQELNVLTLDPDQATTFNQRDAHLAQVYEERVNMEYR